MEVLQMGREVIAQCTKKDNIKLGGLIHLG